MKQKPTRILSIDQLRGYAIFGMIAVNYLGNFHWMPGWFEHTRTNFSYADTIAPLFVFVVGMGFRLSIARRIEKEGLWPARFAAFKRYLILVFLGIIFYGPAAHIDWWDALCQIGLSGIVVLLVIEKSAAIRLAFGLASLALFTALYMGTGYHEWMNGRSMNGGPLSPLAYAFVLLCGTIAYDLMEEGDSKKIVRTSLIFIVSLAAAAFASYALLKPQWESYQQFGEYWMFAKRWSLPPFIFIATSCAFVAYLFFYLVNDIKEFEFPHLTVLGLNPLVIYLVQYSLLAINGSYLPERFEHDGASIVPGLLGFVVFYLVVYAIAWRLWKDKTVIKI
ncbi:MAG: hypothetical protein AMXMBFR84_18330 [Candidatus Hydrogenedentota bacterium]